MEEKFEPNLQAHGGDGGGKACETRIGSNTPRGSEGSKRLRIDSDLTATELAAKLRAKESAVISSMLKFVSAHLHFAFAFMAIPATPHSLVA